MAEIKTLVEEAKNAARLASQTFYAHIAADHLQAMDAALDALAEAHQAEVARLTDDRDSWCQQASARTEDAVRFAGERDAVRAEVARLTRENERLAKNAARLDWMIEAGGFIVWTVRDGTIRQCQVWTQDEDEVFHQPAGEARFFNTTRDAIDAALAGASGAAGEGAEQ